MNKYDLITPEGTRDLLFSESAARRRIEAKVHELFRLYGYSEVLTPGIEFYDVFNSQLHSSGRHFSQESLYKLTDGKGRILVLRPDSTLPIARLVSTRLKTETFPLKLYYNQNVYRVGRKNSAGSDEIPQCGIEIIGGEPYRADIEAVAVAAALMKKLEITDYRLEIGDCSVLNILLKRLPPNVGREKIMLFVKIKNNAELSRRLERLSSSDESRGTCEKLLALTGLFGKEEVFAEAEEVFAGDYECLSEIARLRKFYADVTKICPEGSVRFDLGVVRENGYYTGMMFTAFAGNSANCGQPFLSGGRYDSLFADFGTPRPAVGFAADLDAAAKIIAAGGVEFQPESSGVLVYSADITAAVRRCGELIAEGIPAEISVSGSAAEAESYAKKKNIRKVEII